MSKNTLFANESLDKAIYKWLLTVRSKNAVANTLMLKEKTNFLPKAFGITDFVPSDGWTMHWKRRFNISFKKISGEGKSCTPYMIEPWKETRDFQFGLFYQMNPEKSLYLKKKICIGGKQSKVRRTEMTVSNSLGD